MIDIHPYQYERTVQPAGPAIVQVVPDGPMWAHTQPGFADVRIVDANGDQVPWRTAVQPAADDELALPVLDSGRRGDKAVARVRTPKPVDRVRLVVPDKRFVGVATAYGSDDRRTWTKLGSTQIYAVGGASPARSTTVLLPPNDFRYLEFRATHVSRIVGANVHTTGGTPEVVRVPARVRIVHGGDTVVIDVGYAKVPVDELRIASTTARYDRAFTVVSQGGEVASGRLVRIGGPGLTVVPLEAQGRIIRVRIANGDDPPLRGLRVTTWAHPRPLLVEAGHKGPLTLYYGSRVAPPDYDFARLPVQGTPKRAALGPEHANPDYRVVDTRSFFSKHRSLVTVALALAAALLVAAGGLALRRT